MAPQEGDPGERTDLAKERRTPADFVDRALRRELRLPLRYRREGHEEWHPGETINISESGLLFSSNELLEVDARLEITFQTIGVPMLQSSTRIALIVRRVLSNWPETRLFFGARFRV
jgi:PilZ domain